MAVLTRLQAVTACLYGTRTYSKTISYPVDEKDNLYSKTDTRHPEDVANSIVQTLLTAEKPGKILQARLDSIVGTNGWTEKLAEWALAKMEKALKAGAKMGPALKVAMDKAIEAMNEVEGFARDHPVMCTVIALGVLATLAPWALEALGFAELGIVEDSFAAIWQSRYAGFVPKGSLFSFIQKCGMTLKWATAA
ncbi:hypothetical protein GQ43DRAFT_459249 [Delitschia confertaspora ATCC 74209]|uniref:Uncharacterized protein n=1 Tax=Delitschia confertaspora ATCC 74209 TaxID=1513339 RepID=A0A9P4MQS0_9PLEO|nr:hypothetical protein GQ43DRAFT_459249 [Delitschia confertaspora ATCC 74209]